MNDESSPPAPLIALISATPAAIGPAAHGFAVAFPEAVTWNILDDRLLAEADRFGGLTPALQDRMIRLISHAETEGAAGILLTCSMYGPVAHRYADSSIPILAADDGAFHEVSECRYGRVLLIASIATAAEDAGRRFLSHASAAGYRPELHVAVAPAAFAAPSGTDAAAMTAALVDAYQPFAGRVDAVLLAQYSLAPAAAALEQHCCLPVVTGPASAARLLRSQIAAGVSVGLR